MCSTHDYLVVRKDCYKTIVVTIPAANTDLYYPLSLFLFL